MVQVTIELLLSPPLIFLRVFPLEIVIQSELVVFIVSLQIILIYISFIFIPLLVQILLKSPVIVIVWILDHLVCTLVFTE